MNHGTRNPLPEKIVLASSNPGKLREISAVLAGLNTVVVPQTGFNVTPAEENGLSFVENALIKARNATSCTGLPAIADDSGLIVDALGGAPGVYSSRYAGSGATDARNVEKLLAELASVPQERRTARFICIVVYLSQERDPAPLICQGVWEGRILTAARGANGFGYDPVFYIPAQRCSAAELSPEQKNRLSHRAQALAELARKCRF